MIYVKMPYGAEYNIEQTDIGLVTTAPGGDNHESPILTKDDYAIKRIIKKVSDYYGISFEDMKSRHRSREIILCMKICMYFIRKKTKYTLRETSELFNRVNHTSVIHSVQTIKDLMDSDPKLRDQVKYLESII